MPAIKRFLPRFLAPVAAALLLAVVPARTCHAGTWYHDATTNYLEAENWLEKSSGDWQTMRWHRVGDDGDDACCGKFAESDPLYLDGTSASVTNEVVVCRDLTGAGDHGDTQGTFHIRADLYNDADGPGFRGFALYDFCDKDGDHPDGLREIIRFGITDDNDKRLVYRVHGDNEYTILHNGPLDDADEGQPYEIGVDFNLSWVQLEEGAWPDDKSTFRFSLMDGYRDRHDPDVDNWVPYRFDVRFDDSDWEVNAIGLIASDDTKILFSSVSVDTDPGALPYDLRAPAPYDPGEPVPVRYEWGDEDGVYTIGSLDQLECFAVMLQDYSFPDSTFTLIADIDCEGRKFSPTGEFAGTFDGQGHVISNLRVEAEGDEPAGLFGTLSGTVRDVILVNPVVTGGDCVGALAGEIASDDARVSRCGVIGAAVTASGNCAGAFAGQIGGGAVVSECFAAGTVAAAGNSAGGFAGYVEEATLSDCYAVADVSGKRYAGSFSGKIVGPDNATWIERCYAAGTASGSQNAGGFAGALEDDPELAECFAQDPDAATDGVTALDAAGMRARSNFASWHALDPAVWAQEDGRTQPYFAWGLVGGKFILSGDDAIAGLGPCEPGTNAPVAIDPQDRVFLGWTGTATYADRDNATTTVLVDNHRNVAAELGTIVSDRAGLEAIADDLAGTYILVADIDLAGADWTPLGFDNESFTGTFYGNGHVISHLVVTNHPAVRGRGLFGVTEGATIESVIVRGTVAGAANFAGGLVGNAIGTHITDCHADCSVSNASSYTGGLVGGISEGTTIVRCTTAGTVHAAGQYTGGLVGYCGGDRLSIRDSSSTADVTGNESAGGFVGYVNSGGLEISGCSADGLTGGRGNVGGFAGAVSTNAVATISACTAAGTVLAAGPYTGGLVGYCGGSRLAIRDSVSTADVTGGEAAGGFVGYVNSGGLEISGCRADGFTGGRGKVGGFAGAVSSIAVATISGCVARGDVRSFAPSYGGFVGEMTSCTATNSDCWCSGAIWGTGGDIGAFAGNCKNGTNVNCRVYPYAAGPRYFCGYPREIPGGVLSAADVAALSKDGDGNPWPAVQKHIRGATPIATAEDLLAVTNDLSGVYVLVADIDLGGMTIEPIGIGTNVNAFTGEFYGRGYKISGFTVDTTNRYAGFFGNIAGGRVSDLLLEGRVYSHDNDSANGVGGFAGEIQAKSLVDGCWFTGQVDAGDSGKVGGFVGTTEDSPVILRCGAEDIQLDNPSSDNSDKQFTGGFVGLHNNGFIQDCYATGEVNAADNTDVGGFAGHVASSARIATSWCSVYVYVPMPTSWVGAFVGNADGLVTDSYYDEIRTEQLAQGTFAPGISAACAGIEAAGDMSDPTCLPNLDFDAIWEIDELTGMPAIRRGEQLVAFDPNGGTCDDPDRRYDIGTDYDFLPRPARPGHVFLGWFDAADGGYPIPSDSRVTTDATRTFYAHWIDARARGLPIRALDIGNRTLRYDMGSQANMDAMFPGAGAVFCTVVTSTNLADGAWLAIGPSTNWSANTAGEAGWIPVYDLDTADPVRFWRIAATLYAPGEGAPVEFTAEEEPLAIRAHGR